VGVVQVVKSSPGRRSPFGRLRLSRRRVASNILETTLRVDRLPSLSTSRRSSPSMRPSPRPRLLLVQVRDVRRNRVGIEAEDSGLATCCQPGSGDVGLVVRHRSDRNRMVLVSTTSAYHHATCM